jgi:hypothetical protein
VERDNLKLDSESLRVEHLTDEKPTSFDAQLVQEMTRVCNVVAGGDLSQRVAVKVDSRSGVQDASLVQLKDAINNMVSHSSCTAFDQMILSSSV